MTELNYQNPSDANRERWHQTRLSIFGPSRADIWSRLAEEVGGTYRGGGWTKAARVDVSIGSWRITLDIHTDGETTYTRLRAPYVNADGFRFEVFRKHLFSPLARWLGAQDVEVGHPAFDGSFVIRGSDEEKLRRLLANSRLRQLLAAQPHVWFQVRDDEGWFGQWFPHGVDELRFQVNGPIKDIDRLKGLFDLFAETLNTLCHIGSAYENDPGIYLK